MTKARRTYQRFRPDLRSARPETRSRVTSDCISSQSAHISADSPGESEVASRRVSANHGDAIPDACLNTRWHHGAYLCGCLERVVRSGSRHDSVRGAVGAMNTELSRSDLLAMVQSGRKQA